MPTPAKKNIINLLLKVDSSGYQYLHCLPNGVVVNLQGLNITTSSIINVNLTSDSNQTYIIDSCTISPSGQTTVTSAITGDTTKTAVITDTDDEQGSASYYFSVTVLNRNTQVPTTCDPQIQNKGTM